MTMLFLYALMFQDRTTSLFVDRIAVKVNDKIITERELVRNYEELRRQAMENATGSELDKLLSEAWQQALQEAEETLLFYEKAVEVGVAYSREDTVTLLENMREQAGMTQVEFEKEVANQTGMSLEALIDKRMRDDSARAVIQTQVLNRITFEDNEVAKYYADHKDEFMIPATYRIAEIVIRRDGVTPSQVQQKIDASLTELEAGKPFAEVARAYSDSYSKESGGDLGVVEYGDLLAVIEDTVRSLEVGAVSEPLETPTSYFIIKILEKNPAQPKPLEEVRDEILAAMREPRMDAALQEFLEELRAEFVVETYVKVLPSYLQH